LAEAIVRQWSASSPGPLTTIGGSDSHTLGGIGTTHTEAAGIMRDEFLQSLREGRARAGGRHGSTWREAREIYGVVGRYWAALLGAGPRRTLELAFPGLSMPFEFSPLVVAALHTRDEARRVSGYRRVWEVRCPIHRSGPAAEPAGFLLAPDAATEPP
jgi:PHP domain-containing protein